MRQGLRDGLGWMEQQGHRRQGVWEEGAAGTGMHHSEGNGFVRKGYGTVKAEVGREGNRDGRKGRGKRRVMGKADGTRGSGTGRE
ncbi:hypothetical protein E2C01_099571 [Portunus trituberculatus]|uniref:Uncharacterized protein n=1 Tax=Portunus trituberculatus TaxID=210409 RepID=A0A5B7K5U8_PORTR|nr:hypothetical protein [Portunus trituberculatus]